MASLIYRAADYVKQAFSATESYLLQLRGAVLVVLTVLKPTIHEREFFIQSKKGEINNYSQDFQYTNDETTTGNDQETPQVEERERQSFFAYIIGSLCYPFFPCAQILLPTKCIPKSSGQNSCTPVECNCCSCMQCNFGFCNWNCICQFLRSQYFCNTMTFLCPFLLFGFLFWNYYDEYVSQLLNSFEEMDEEYALAIFIVLFMIASLPLVWGYVILNLAAGYRYGIFQGVIVVMISVTIGLTLTHKISKRFCAGCIFRMLRRQSNAEYIDGILKVLDSPSGLKVIALTRLTPIPFGLQNGIFAMSNIQTRHYVAASNIGLFPTQILNCYIGSTFHSAEDIMSRGGSVGGYLIFLIQLSIGIALMTFVIRHARKELAAALKEPTDKSEKIENDDDGDLDEVKITQPSADSQIV